MTAYDLRIIDCSSDVCSSFRLVVALRLAPIPVHRIVEVPGRRELEMHGLAGERAEARGEEQEPGEQLRSVFGRAQKLPSLLGEIDQDRGGVEDPRLDRKSTRLNSSH